MKIKKFLPLILTLFVLLSIVSCELIRSALEVRNMSEDERRNRNYERWERLPERVQEKHRRASSFASVFWFTFEGKSSEEGNLPLRVLRRSGHRNVAIVASQEEAANGDENTFYFWPNPNVTPRLLTVVNYILCPDNPENFAWSVSPHWEPTYTADDVDRESLPFPIPITEQDLIVYWEEILEFCFRYEITRRMDYPNSYENVRILLAVDNNHDDWFEVRGILARIRNLSGFGPISDIDEAIAEWNAGTEASNDGG